MAYTLPDSAAIGTQVEISPGLFVELTSISADGKNVWTIAPSLVPTEQGTKKKRITSTSYVISPTDVDYLLEYNNAANGTITIPDGLPEEFTVSIVPTGAGIPTLETAATGNNIVTSEAGSAVATVTPARRFAAVTATHLTGGNYLVAGEVA